jgi:hypothetical protein
MGETTILLTAPCGCQVYEELDEYATWGVLSCDQHGDEDLAPEVAEYFGVIQEASK